ncbi:MAG: hypothetical protein HOP18_11715 [Deltaproteobacteria bacterium]|nr:hypothetical protein [Deltaproteobacteria bacterium]
MLLVESHPHASTFMATLLLYVPLGGSLPTAAGMLGPVLAVLFTLLAGSLVFFRRVMGRALTFLRQHWQWTLLTVASLTLLSGALIFWWS